MRHKKNKFWIYWALTPIAGLLLMIAWAARLRSLNAGHDAFWFTTLLLPLTVIILFILGILMSREAVNEFKKKRTAVSMVLTSGLLTVLLSVATSGLLAARACEGCTGASVGDAALITLLFFLPILCSTLLIPPTHKKNSL